MVEMALISTHPYSPKTSAKIRIKTMPTKILD
jgi:hypothetical protein